MASAAAIPAAPLPMITYLVTLEFPSHMVTRPEKICALKTQHTPRAARYTLAAGQTAAVVDGFPFPGVSAHINTNWACEGANTALHAADRLRDNLPFHQCFAPINFSLKNILQTHTEIFRLQTQLYRLG